MDYNAAYERWTQLAHDPGVKAELAQIRDDENEKKARFSVALTFGTAGLRGVLGAGTGRMNIYTVRQATQGLAAYVREKYGEGCCVAIAYDSRNMSTKFAEESAAVLAANGVTAYLYDRLMPTPMLSFAVRTLGARAGIMITASHNPAQYNGYKAYGEDGCQMTEEAAGLVYDKIQQIDVFDGVRYIGFEKGLAAGAIRYIPETVTEQYYEAVKARQINPGVCARSPIKLVYSPLNGTGNEPVRRVLADIGVSELTVVPEQEKPDGDFPTCTYPNPETREALRLGLALCAQTKPDLFIATDPDADRVGVAFRDGEEYTILSGNEVGVLLLDYIIKARRAAGTMPERPVAVESIVSTPMAAEVAKRGGVEMRTVLTGFKYIGEQILHLEQAGETERFIFGFEESCGYLSGGYVRDKDAVLAAMLICEMTAYYKEQGKTPIEVLGALYEEYGYYRNRVLNFAFEGLEGPDKMQAVMDSLFAAHPAEIAGNRVTTVCDYKAGRIIETADGTSRATGLPSAAAIEFRLEGGGSVMVRPSGTEPKMKLYLTAKEKTAERSVALLDALAADMQSKLGLA